MKSTEPLLIVFATFVEAKHSIQSLQATEQSPNLYRFPGGVLLISGMGCLAAAYAVSAFQEKVSRVWNFGAAGSLHGDMVLGQVVEVATVQRNPLLPEGIDNHSSALHQRLFPSLTLAEKGYKLISSDYPVHHPDINQSLRQHGDLIDMEGYGIAYAAQQKGIPASIWKTVSDFATTDGPKLIQEWLEAVSSTLAAKLMDLIDDTK